MDLELTIENFSFSTNEKVILRDHINSDAFIKMAQSKAVSSSKTYSTTILKTKEIILKYPRFASYDHPKVLERLIKIYGIDNESKLKIAILKFPQFTGLNHYRVLRQKNKLGRLLNISDNQIKNILLTKPNLTGYSYKRDLAIIDIIRELNNKNLIVTQKQVLNNFAHSPYVPNTKRLRISKAKKKGLLNQMPKMYRILRNIAIRNRKENL